MSIAVERYGRRIWVGKFSDVSKTLRQQIAAEERTIPAVREGGPWDGRKELREVEQ